MRLNAGTQPPHAARPVLTTLAARLGLGALALTLVAGVSPLAFAEDAPAAAAPPTSAAAPPAPAAVKPSPEMAHAERGSPAG